MENLTSMEKITDIENRSNSVSIYHLDGDLLLRTAEIADADMIADYFQKNREYLKPFEPKREETFYTVNGWLQHLIKLNDLHRLGLGFYCVIIDTTTKKMQGTLSFSNLTRFPFYCCNVGYSLAESAQGKGLMRRALKMGCDYIFRVQKLHRIQASYMPHNYKSEAVLNHLGFEKEGYARDYLLIDDKWEDHVLTSLTNPTW
ncbi:ribosomal protein S5 alanine N-acetyltransferase [Vibrio sagamiensis NBRC 104589]|uniref:Ribosomal protein S5 alanine N-acetyltransferase n=2 Tax=Vibrio sagamiensis TaxID=512650 RepID=A0A511QB88_9VIBR|nr:ribosomal protein S5 alanine N-acetyltransferase [Vibrio sagamiensis NBRC 104589]